MFVPAGRALKPKINRGDRAENCISSWYFLICYMVSSSLHFLIFSALSKFIFRFHRIILHEFSSLNDQSLCPPLFLINVGGNGAL